MRLELAWGCVRRAYLKRVRPRYVRRMAELRRGDHNTCPHEVLDPRDVKFYRNQGGYYWEPEDDSFRWRDRLPFARAGLAELLLLGGGFALLTVVALWVVPLIAVLPSVGLLAVVWFFRSPRRSIPKAPGAVVAPADGKVVSIDKVEHDEFIGGQAVLIGIFLSVLNVHINRVPRDARVIYLRYRPGKFLNALLPRSARENEQLAVGMQETSPPYRKMVVRQIAGTLARRIVCWVAPDERLQRGDKFGMIKLGSRTELLLPWEENLKMEVAVGDRVKAGATVLATYSHEKTVEAP